PTSEKIRVLERAIDELQGYVLLADGKPADAYERLKKATNVDEPYLAEVQRLAGKTDDALKALREYVEAHENEVSPLAHLVQMLWQLDKKDEAKQSFEKLRAISGQLDLDAPPFARLTPIAIELGFGADWRVMQPAKPDVGNRPSLDSLGPLTWQPSPAADWSLPDAEGKLRTLAEYRGRPVVVIFYLGFGCLHCAEQLQAFAPKTKEYADAGVSLIAISTDSLDDLKKSHARYKTDESFPFPLVSDDSFAAFKLYQAFDDFEKVPLHATYLIDGEGRIRWHDIGAEPFKSVDFLLREAKRQLHPNQIDLPTEPTLLDISQPANAMAPRNVFPPTPPPAKPTAPGPMTKETEKPNVAAG
ncbi:MAG: alkyl hydroperoxide reductase, partial [Planctomycetota bacterium]